MHIEPNSTVIVCSGVPWDPDYTHAMNWSNMGASTQASIVKTYQKFEFNRMTYQRSNRGYIRVEKSVDDLYDCNYLMFQNTNYGNKWFYAFITQVNYINDITTEIIYAIDVITTWWFDCEIGTCFIERAHTLTDVPGDNLLPEPLEIGDYIINRQLQPMTALRTLSAVVACTFTVDDFGIISNDPPPVKMYQGVPTALAFYSFQIPSQVDRLSEFIENVNSAGKIDGIVSIYFAPSSFASLAGSDTQIIVDERLGIQTPTALGDLSNPAATYEPKNKKLLTYPYITIYVTDLQGNAKSYPFEYFNSRDETKTFGVMGNASPQCNPIIAPKNYKGQGVTVNNNPNQSYNLDEKMVLPNYPQIAYINDVYKNWLALNRVSMLAYVAGVGSGASMDYVPPATTPTTQNSAPTMAPLVSNETALTTTQSQGIGPAYSLASFGATVSGAAGGPAGAAAGAITGYVAAKLLNTFDRINSVLVSKYSHSLLPDQARGVGDNTIMCGAGIQNFFFGVKSIRAEYARIIDNYFDMFGYAVHRIGTPRTYIGQRKSHTYIKTVGAHVDGSIPADAAQAMCAIYDNGITFWNDQNEIGNYFADNSPIN